MQNIKQYLIESQLVSEQLNDDNAILEAVYQTIIGKDKNIKCLESQLIKYKADHIKDQKTIKLLQDKLTSVSPNTNNTGSNFMMASQFKDNFDEFMKNNLSITLSPLLDYPQAYSQYTIELLEKVYSNMESSLDEKMCEICKILGISTQQSDNKTKIKQSLLKIIQDNWQDILEIPQFLQPQSKKLIKLNYSNQEVNEIQSSQEFIDMQNSLNKLCAYMILQDRPWKFITNDNKQPKSEQNILKFVKKDHICFDGWIREGQNIKMVLQGIYRQSENKQQVKHPNLKNFVIPFRDTSNQYYLVKNQEKDKQQQVQKVNSEQIDNRQRQFHMEQNSELAVLSETRFRQVHKENESKLQILHKESRLNTLQPLGNVQNEQIQVFSGLSSPMAPLRPIYLNTNQDNKSLKIKQNKGNNREIKQKNYSKNNRKGNHSKSKHGLITEPSFQQISAMPKNRESSNCTINSNKHPRKKKDIDQLPLRRQINNNSRAKKNTSRKGSVGKIVEQVIDHNNYNKIEKQNRNINKEIMYKDLIKQKLCDSGAHKTQRVSHGHQKDIFKCNKQREEDRPLRMMHMKKIREKYLNI